MNRQKWILLAVTLALIGGSAGLLAQLRSHQRLGAPGVKTRLLGDGPRLEVVLPEHVLDYRSEAVPLQELVTNMLPKDTSFGQRRYEAPDGSTIQLNVVLMGADRTSIHKPQFCLEGAGWHINPTASQETTVRVERPVPYDLPIVKLIANGEVTLKEGQRAPARAVFVYWFVAEDALTASLLAFQRNWMMARDLLTKGILQRWAYVSCMAVCQPGQEDVTYQRIREFISAATPEFQLVPRPPAAGPAGP